LSGSAVCPKPRTPERGRGTGAKAARRAGIRCGPAKRPAEPTLTWGPSGQALTLSGSFLGVHALAILRVHVVKGLRRAISEASTTKLGAPNQLKSWALAGNSQSLEAWWLHSQLFPSCSSEPVRRDTAHPLALSTSHPVAHCRLHQYPAC